MSLVSSLRSQIAALVHADAVPSSVERARHKIFICVHLASSLAAACLMPPYLIYRGLPTPWEAGAFAFLLLPLAAVIGASKTGRLIEAQAICLVSIVGLVVSATMGGVPSGAALMWLMLIPVEAALAGQSSLILAGSAGAIAAALVLAAAVHRGIPGEGASVSILANAAFAVPGIIYAAGLALGFQHLERLRRRLERLTKARYRGLCDAVGDIVLGLDRFGNVTRLGRQTQTLAGITAYELSGRGLFDRIHVADRPTFLKAVADARASGRPTLATLRLRNAAAPGDDHGFGEPVFAWIEMRLQSVEGLAETGEAAPIMAVVRDVTSNKQYEQDLEAARAEAERASMWKDRFLANVSHELRTPLNAIIGFAEMLASEQLSPSDPAKQREYAQIIHTSGEHLLAVVNTILDISKIEAGSFDIVPEPFAIGPLIESCCDMVRLRAEQAGIRLTREPADGSTEIVADKRACKQILLNLLSNAVKFTPVNGCVTVGARLDGTAIVVFVRDTGVGIPPRDLPRLGDPFFQAQGNYDRQYEGTGLGLSVVRGLVGLHGGSIAIDSAPGAGTMVNVRLPLDCRLAARTPRGLARIEAFQRPGAKAPSPPDIHSPMVKKIA